MSWVWSYFKKDVGGKHIICQQGVGRKVKLKIAWKFTHSTCMVGPSESRTPSSLSAPHLVRWHLTMSSPQGDTHTDDGLEFVLPQILLHRDQPPRIRKLSQDIHVLKSRRRSPISHLRSPTFSVMDNTFHPKPIPFRGWSCFPVWWYHNTTPSILG